MNPLMNMPGQTQAPNLPQMLEQIRKNPSGVLSQVGYQIPGGMSNPNEILHYLLQSGQISNGRLANLQKMAQAFQKRA